MYIQPFTPNMEISRSIIEGHSDHSFIDTAKKIAIYTLIPMALIVFTEAFLKNIILINLANSAITIINAGYNLYESIKRKALDCIGY